MSVLDFPRIHFNGQFSTNVCTANNDDVGIMVYNPVTNEIYPPLAGMPDTEARKWLEQLTSNGQYVRSGWNYYGDHAVIFNGASVSQVTLAPGQSPVDPLLNQGVTLNSEAGTPPVMVDVDPTGSYGTQIFSNGFQVGGQTLGLLAQARSVCFTRWIGLRNLSPSITGFTAAAATWQFGVPTSAVTFFGADKSPALAALEKQAASAAGLMIQFCTYLLMPALSATELVAKFAQGIPQPNPAIGYVVGTIGVWNHSDWATAPNGRRLLWTSPSNPFLPATAQLHPSQKVVSLNLITTFPDQGGSSPATPPASPHAAKVLAASALQRTDFAVAPTSQPRKVDFGTVTLEVIPAGGGTPVTIGPLTGYNDYQQYFQTAGTIDVAYGDDSLTSLIQKGTLLLRSSKDPRNALLSEQTLVVDSDDRVLYFEPGQSRTLNLRALDRGQVPAAPIPLTLVIQPSGAVSPAGNEISYQSGQTNSDGTAQLPVSGIYAGLMVLQWLAPGESSDPNDFNPATSGFTNIRVMPFDDFSNFPLEQRLSWPFVYRNALRYYWVIFPAMQRIIDLSDEQSVVGAGQVILERLSESLSDSVLAMPVTRSMSSGRRDLIRAFLASKLGTS